MLSYLIFKKNISVEEALFQLRLKYPKADPNLGFLLQLKQFHAYLNSPGLSSQSSGELFLEKKPPRQEENEKMEEEYGKENFKAIQVME